MRNRDRVVGAKHRVKGDAQHCSISIVISNADKLRWQPQREWRSLRIGAPMSVNVKHRDICSGRVLCGTLDQEEQSMFRIRIVRIQCEEAPNVLSGETARRGRQPARKVKHDRDRRERTYRDISLFATYPETPATRHGVEVIRHKAVCSDFGDIERRHQRCENVIIWSFRTNSICVIAAESE